MNEIINKDINLGGISDSPLQGLANSVSELVGFDIHSKPGFLKVNQGLVLASGTLVDDLVEAILPCSDGNTYLFGRTNGKIWRRDGSGVYTLQATAVPGVGHVGIMSAWEYMGFIYYSMQNKIGRVAVGAPTVWAGRNDAWDTFTNGNDYYHPMQEVNQVLYIGDGNLLAQIDTGVFSANALDVASPYIMKSLGKNSTNILIGTYVNANNAITQIFDWNTWSDSFSYSDDIPEIGINSFIHADNFSLCSCGTKGNLYYYDGTRLKLYKRIPGDYGIAKDMEIKPGASCNYFGLPLFGVSNISGNPAKEGVWSLGGYDQNYRKVLNFEWPISTGHTTNIEIGNITLVGDILLVSWKDKTVPAAIVYGVDELSATQKLAEAYYVTRLINGDRKNKKTLKGFVAYSNLPTGSSIEVWYKTNYATNFTQATLVHDAKRCLYEMKVNIVDANVLQVKVLAKTKTTTVGQVITITNDAPEIEQSDFYFE